MTKDPNKPIEPGDRLPLPKDFGKSSGKVLPFGQRKVPPLPERRKFPEFDAFLPPQFTAEERADLEAAFNAIEHELEQDLEDTPVNMLKEVIKDIEKGKIHPAALVVSMIDYKPNGTEDYPCYITGFSRLALRGLLYHLLDNLP